MHGHGNTAQTLSNTHPHPKQRGRLLHEPHITHHWTSPVCGNQNEDVKCELIHHIRLTGSCTVWTISQILHEIAFSGDDGGGTLIYVICVGHIHQQI